jgi:hypothetical protein
MKLWYFRAELLKFYANLCKFFGLPSASVSHSGHFSVYSLYYPSAAIRPDIGRSKEADANKTPHKSSHIPFVCRICCSLATVLYHQFVAGLRTDRPFNGTNSFHCGTFDSDDVNNVESDNLLRIEPRVSKVIAQLCAQGLC